MLLRDLLAHPGLHLRLLHGSDRDLDRGVRWVYTTDLIDPGRYLSGGELVISGLVWRNDPADSERFVAAVAASGAAALAAGEAVFHTVPDDLVQACRRHGVPLIAVPEETSFGTVTEIVVGAVTAARGDRLAHTLGRQRELLSAVASGAGLDELVAQVSAATGVGCRVLSASGRRIAGPPLSDDLRDRLVATFLTAQRLPARVGAGCSVLLVGPGAGARVTSWFVVADGRFDEWESEVADAVGELVAIAALDRARRGEGQRVASAIADDAVALLAGGAHDRPETAVRLRQAGLRATGALSVVVAGFAGRPDLAETARTILLDVGTAEAGDAPVVGVSDGTAVALLPGPVDAVDAALQRLGPGLPGTLLVGTSRPADPGTLAGALREAQHARELAHGRPGTLHVVAAAEVTSHVALLAAVPDEVRRAFAASVLDPVLAYDERTGAGLVGTLEAFLECSGSWSRTAERLHLHVNTVRYRIGRVEELTARDLSTLADRVDVWLALRAR
ncbi:PucR family transcriptional regulator [Pseudonocardia benzenivorans]|uniref:PucR family transcriptional regulator n=1 Tax=Pseudonocardia benzenivorans TaxID=228005 RepID=A0ABW3VES4_9PSEU